ncbi:MAG: acyl-CoA dehydratase activase-related protein, partial [Candidatus Margulisiibacteriota bacterium]
PKGNTDVSVKIAPNYIELYKKILENHLSKFSVPFDSKPSDKERILIPRSLSFLNEKGVFYTALYNALGFEVVVSPESDDHIANLGISHSHSEACYPIKLAHGHAALLKERLREGRDKILLVNLIGSDIEKYKFCPYVASAGFSVKNSLHLENEDVLLPVLHFNDPDYKLEEAIKKDLDRVFHGRFSLAAVGKAVNSALKAQGLFLDEAYAKGEKFVNRLEQKNERIFIGIGRGYTILDDKASSRVHELFASYGLHFIPSFFLKSPAYDIAPIADNMYWCQGQTMIKYNLQVALDPLLYPVRETNFNCGTDSIILYHEEDIMNKATKPQLVLETDGHNSNAQFGTRTLANAEVVKTHEFTRVKMEDFRRVGPKTVFKKIMGIPYMGDATYGVIAAFKGFGYKSELIPTQTEESKYFARKLVTTNTCRPFAFMIGDVLAWMHGLKARGIDPNKDAVVFVPKAYGPCRFGQYSVMLRRYLDELGFAETPIIDVDADQDYNNLPISGSEIVRVFVLVYKGIVCGDLLYDALLRTRPYEKEKGIAEKRYKNLCEELHGLIEKRPSTRQLAAFMQNAKQGLEAVVDYEKKRKPMVVLSGEIFVRCHPIANQESIRLLEKYGLEVVLQGGSQWVDYTNKYNISVFKDTKKWSKLLVALVKKWYIKHVRNELRKPLAKYLIGREAHDPAHIVEAPQKALIYEKLIGGESPLSIGEAYLFSKGDLGPICGVYHVGPFGCMHETVASTIINAFIQKQRTQAKEINFKIVPFMDAVFGDSELPNLEAEIAAFAEKCCLKKEISKI